MPHLQKLYERLKDRSDIVVLTFNVDDNVGLIEPFLQQNKYTFPVLPAKALVEVMLPMLSIPRNWIVDREGVARQEMIGFGNAEKWEDMVVETLEKARTASSGSP